MFGSTLTTTVGMAMMITMMMMMTMAAAVPKPSGHSKHLEKTNKKSHAAMETVPLQLDPSTLFLTETIRPLENASISPWTYNISKDPSLFRDISEARCLFQGCLDSEGREDLSLESKPIKREMLLLRKVDSGDGANKAYHFRLESRVVAVGCTCVRPAVLYQR